MWTIDNATPFCAERAWVRDKNGAEVWLVAVKGTFTIMPDGTTVPAQVQEPVVLAPEFRGEPRCSSLLNDTDLPHRKLSTDVLLHGHAHAENAEPIKSCLVGIKVATVEKLLRVTGDRTWLEGLGGIAMSDPRPFTSLPVTYERAFGGQDLNDPDSEKHAWDVRNPAGVGFATKASHLIGTPVPNVEYPESLLTDWRQRPTPAGLGPVAGHWSPRVELAGTYDEHWEKTRLPLLAEDFNDLYYQSAPTDQQVHGGLQGGETVQLYNLTPGGKFAFKLPRYFLAFTTYFNGGSQESHRPSLHTVLIKPDDMTFVMVWHTHLPCHSKVNSLNKTTIKLKKSVLGSATRETAVVDT